MKRGSWLRSNQNFSEQFKVDALPLGSFSPPLALEAHLTVLFVRGPGAQWAPKALFVSPRTPRFFVQVLRMPEQQFSF